MINTDAQCFGCPNAYYVEEDGKQKLIGCINSNHVQGIVVKNSGEGITCLATDKGFVVYKHDIDYCPMWHH